MGGTHRSTMDGEGQEVYNKFGILWSREIEAAILAQKVSYRKIRSGNVGDESLLWQWKENRRRHVKRLVRLEKKTLRKATIVRTREQGETSCKLFWEDLKGKKKQYSIQSERRRWSGSGEEEGYIGGLGQSLERSGEGTQGRMSQLTT